MADRDIGDLNDDDTLTDVSSLILVRLPNGIPLAPHYQQLLDYFARDVLASLSVHPAIHRDIAQGLVPEMLHTPHLLSAGLALAATGLASRGLSEVGSVGLPRVTQHLQTSGLALLRQALAKNNGNNGRPSSDRTSMVSSASNSNLMATCLLWCLADVFAADGASLSSSSTSSITSSTVPSSASLSSWRIHLQGIEALLGGARALDAFVTRGRGDVSSSSSSSSFSSRSAMGHLHQLYRALQTLPQLARRRRHAGEAVAADTLEMAGSRKRDGRAITVAKTVELNLVVAADNMRLPPKSPSLPRMIDGFLGYSEELLDILQQVADIASKLPPTDAPENINVTKDIDDIDELLTAPHLTGTARIAANQLLARAQAEALNPNDNNLYILAGTPPLRVSHIPAPALTAASTREFALCHGCFQQATLIHFYRQIFRLPSRACLIQKAVAEIRRMAGQMTQGAPCSAWVAMALPLFTVGSEAYTPAAQAWAHAALAAFAASIGSRHVQLLHRALEDIWLLRARRGDVDGRLCADALLGELNYNIIMF